MLAQARRIERQNGHHRRSYAPMRAPAQQRGNCSAAPRIIDPTAFGADPTGKTDSTAAFTRAVAALLSTKAVAPHAMAAHIKDLGGATLDLGGGQYLLSAPVVIPPMYGNLHVSDGTLRASPTFPDNRWLVEIGSATECFPKLPNGQPDTQGCCNEFVGIESVLFDAGFTAAGGVRVAKTMGATIGPSVFFTGFTSVGIRVDNGHEAIISDAWLAECYWSENTMCTAPGRNSTSIGIQINGNDHYLDNVIVFDWTKTGVEINGAANILTAVHTWNGGGVGIALGNTQSAYGGHQNRILGCYLDYNTLDLYDPSSTVVESTFFLATHAVLHAVQGSVSGLIFRYNTYTTPESIVLDGAFPHPKNVRIADEIGAAKATTATKSLTQSGAPRWVFNFTAELLFPRIEQVTYSVVSDSKVFFNHLARTPNWTQVVVETSVPVTATVVVTAAQAL